MTNPACVTKLRFKKAISVPNWFEKVTIISDYVQR